MRRYGSRCLLTVRILKRKSFCILHLVFCTLSFCLLVSERVPFFITIIYMDINFKPQNFDTFPASPDFIFVSNNLHTLHKHIFWSPKPTFAYVMLTKRIISKQDTDDTLTYNNLGRVHVLTYRFNSKPLTRLLFWDVVRACNDSIVITWGKGGV